MRQSFLPGYLLYIMAGATTPSQGGRDYNLDYNSHDPSVKFSTLPAFVATSNLA
jgi:hypothetical protein